MPSISYRYASLGLKGCGSATNVTGGTALMHSDLASLLARQPSQPR